MCSSWMGGLTIRSMELKIFFFLGSWFCLRQFRGLIPGMPSWSCKTLQKWVLCSNKKLLNVAECCGSLTSLFQFVQRVRMTTKSLSTNGKKWKVLLMTRTKWWAQVQTLLCFSSSLLSLESTHSSRSSGGSVQLFASFCFILFFLSLSVKHVASCLFICSSTRD